MSTTETVSHTQAPVNDTTLEITNKHSLPVIITLILLSFFFFGFFSIYFVRCILTFFVRRGNTGNTPPAPPTKAQGLDPSILDTFPTFVYSSVKDLREDKGILECAVCLSEFEDSDMLRLLTVCNHAFHPDCIDLWLGSHTTCPVCRRSLDPEEKGQEISITIDGEDGTTTLANEGDETGTNHSVGESSHRMVSVHENAQEEEEGRSRVVNGDDDDDDDDNHEGGEDEDHVDDDLERGNNNNREHAAVDNMMLRSHSTGHSIIRKDVDRYTLRLPENVKESIKRGHHHNWTASCITFGEFTGDVTAGKSGLGEVSGVSNGDIIRV